MMLRTCLTQQSDHIMAGATVISMSAILSGSQLDLLQVFQMISLFFLLYLDLVGICQYI